MSKFDRTARQIACRQTNCGGMWRSDDNPHSPSCESLTDIIAAALKAAVEDCARAVCRECADPKNWKPSVFVAKYEYWYHHDDVGNEVGCRASPIRSRSKGEE